MRSLDAIFAPNAIAVIGASTTPGKVGYDIFANILKGGYQGTLYPVNPAARSILSMRAYPSVSEIPDAVDLAIIVLSADATLKAVEESSRKGVKGVVIVSAGFREVGKKGLEAGEPDRLDLPGGRDPRCRAELPRGHQSSPAGEHECEFLRQDAQPRQHLLHLPERRPLYGRSRLRSGPGIRFFEIHLDRQQGGRG